MKRLQIIKPSGQELMEFALILPIFALIIFGITDLGRVVLYYTTMSNAAREGARYGSIHVEIVDLDSKVCNQVKNLSVAVNVTCDDVNTIMNFVDGTVTVTVDFNFDPITPFFRTINLPAKSNMYLEYNPN